jgi:succinylglutamate desuccinylase
MKWPSKVVIVGGTHGNEWTGITIVKHFQESLRKKFPQLELEFLFANPEAYALNKRFKDEDLNRAFQYLDQNKVSYEHARAKEIKSLIQVKECLVIDLHTTTSNMGKTVIISEFTPVIFSLCAKIQEEFDDCRIIGAPDPSKKYLASQSEHGIILEVGPVANGIVSADILESTLKMLDCLLDGIMKQRNPQKRDLEIYQEAQDIFYPENDKGEINGYIHSYIQGKDFLPLKGKFKAFKTFQGVDTELENEEELYPIFINEAAYYSQKLAFTLCRKMSLSC